MLKRLQAVSQDYLIGYPTRWTEFELHAELFWKLKAAGLDVYGEVNWESGGVGRRQKCRFDLVIFDGGIASEIVEVKGNKVKHRNGVERTRQGTRYTRFGVPVTFVYGPEGVKQYLSERLGA